MTIDTDELQASLQKIKDVKRKNTGAKRSRLDRYRGEIIALQGLGASLSDIKDWLRSEKRTVVSRSTVAHNLRRWATRAEELQVAPIEDNQNA